MILNADDLSRLPHISSLTGIASISLILEVSSLGVPWGVFGGSVRDRVLGREPGDLDLLTMAPHNYIRSVCCGYGLSEVYFTPDAGATPLPEDKTERDAIPESLRFYSGNGVEISSAPNIYRWTERPSLMDRADFSINNIVVWVDGLVSAHPRAVSDLQRRVLRVVRPENYSSARAERFLSWGFRWAKDDLTSEVRHDLP